MADLQYKLVNSAKVGDVSGVEKALGEGARVDDQDLTSGRAPIHHASAAGHVDIVRLLLARGAQVDLASTHPGDAGATPVHLAAEGGYSQVLTALLAAGAVPDIYDYNTIRGRREVLEVLLDHGCDLSSRAGDWTTPLHHAAAQGHLFLVKWLVKNGGRLDLTDKAGRTPQEYSRVRYHRRVYRYFKNIMKAVRRPLSATQKPFMYNIRSYQSKTKAPNPITLSRLPIPKQDYEKMRRLNLNLNNKQITPRHPAKPFVHTKKNLPASTTPKTDSLPVSKTTTSEQQSKDLAVNKTSKSEPHSKDLAVNKTTKSEPQSKDLAVNKTAKSEPQSKDLPVNKTAKSEPQSKDL
ncbi:Ankyrin repeat domain-containing protein 50-like 3, partial [Homarus americanus]